MTATLPIPQGDARPASKAAMWTGRGLSGFAAAFLLMDGAMKLAPPQFVIDATVQAGIPANLITPIGVILLCFTTLYLIPRTTVFGAILLTGYLGGAVLTHFRHGDPLFSHVLFPVYIASMAWIGLYLREPRLRELVPYSRKDI